MSALGRFGTAVGVPVLLCAAGLVAWIARHGGEPEPRARVERPAGGGWPRVARLSDGRQVEIPAPPERIVLASSGAVDLVSELVPPERVRAVPEQAFWFSRLREEPGAFASVERFDRFVAESVLAFDPDLVVCDPWGAPQTAARLDEAGIAVVSLGVVRGLDDVRRQTELLGGVLGVEEEASALLAELDRRIARLAERAEDRARWTAISYDNAGAGGWTAGAGTTVDEILALAGLENLSAAIGLVDHQEIGYERLLALDPDVIVVAEPSGSSFPGEGEGELAGGTEAFLRNEPVLASLRAIREDRIVAIPVRLFSTTSHEIVRGAEVLADRLDRLRERAGATPR